MSQLLNARVAHWLVPNIRAASPTQLLFVDTESRPFVRPERPDTEFHSLRLGVAQTCRIERGRCTRFAELQFTTAAEFWRWTIDHIDPRRKTWLYAHNIGFDLTLLEFWAQLERGTFRLADDDWPLRMLHRQHPRGKRPWRGTLIAKDPPTIITVRAGGATLTLCDTLNYWRCSLSALADNIGMVKGEMPSFDAPDADWFAYCRQDTSIIFKAITELLLWWRREDYGHWRATVSGLAWNAFRHKWMTEKSILVHDDRHALSLERAAYFGGETRSFYVGPILKAGSQSQLTYRGKDAGWCKEFGPVHILDVQSMYPSVMRANLYPAVHCWYQAKPRKHLDQFDHAGLELIATVKLRTPEETFPIRVKGRTRYARGEFWTALAGPELVYAARMGFIQEISEMSCYRLSELFTAYVDHFWHLRQQYKSEGRKIWDTFAKMLLNTLPGRFGMLSPDWTDEPGKAPPMPWGTYYEGHAGDETPQVHRAIAWHSQRSLSRSEASDSVPAIPAFVCSYARNLIRALRKDCAPGNIYYQHTDSLHVDAVAFAQLRDAGRIQPNVLGALREVKMVEDAHYFGINHYRVGDENICGAVRKRAVRGPDGEYVYPQFQGLKSMLSSRPDATVRVTMVAKTVSDCHPDGSVGPDGWITPLTLP